MAKQPQPFLALVIPAEPTEQGPPAGGPPGQRPGGPPGQGPGGGGPPGQQPGGGLRPMPPIYIDPPERPPNVPEGSKLVLVWDGEDWQWVMLSGTDQPQPKRR